MPTPYQRPPHATPTDVPRLVRPVQGRMLAGVCAGLAVHLGVSVVTVRVITVLLAFSGSGIAGYLFLWAFTPEGDPVPARARRVARPPAGIPSPPGAPDAASSPGPLAGAEVREGEPGRQSAWLLVIGAGTVALGLAWLVERAGVDLHLNVVVPVLVIGVGAVIAFGQLDAAQRSRWLGSDRQASWRAATRFGLGLVLVLVGLVVLVSRGASLPQLWDVTLATLAVLAGVLLLAAPWAVRVWSDLRLEQAARARADERADIAAHLHDSVLQTLALIQRTAGDPATVSRLARAQERELRSWLYAGPSGSDATLAAAVAGAAHEVEDAHGIPVDLVVTGDRPLDPHGEALVRAVREALVNAVRHGAPPVSVYLEVSPGGVEAFVRDHGCGFDPGTVSADRLGIRESIVGRMDRHGGSAQVRRLEEGTEVALTLPPLPSLEGAS